MRYRLFKNEQFPTSFMNWEKLGNKHSLYQYFKMQMLNLWMSLKNLSFTVEKEMGNSQKRGWSHFKLNIND